MGDKNKSYSLEEIHSSDNLCYDSNNNVYDINKFIKEHPGGDSIKFAVERYSPKKKGNIEQIWEDKGVEFHFNNERVEKVLKRIRVGVIGTQTQNIKENYISSETKKNKQ